MAYITATYLSEAVGAAKYAALTDGPNAARLIEQATGETESALSVGGYAVCVPSTVYASDASDCPAVIKLAAFGAWLELAYGAADRELPENYRAHVRKLEDLRTGTIEIAAAARSVLRGTGGVGFSESSVDVDGSKPQIFGRSSFRTGGY